MAEVMIYVTTATPAEALRIGRLLIEERLAACANVLPQITSVFRWEGSIQEESEAVLIAKTTDQRAAEVVERIKAAHSYTCPCVVVLPIVGGNPAFLDWIRSETQPG